MSAQTLLAASAALAAVSFAILCGFAVKTLLGAGRTMDSLRTTLEKTNGTVESIRDKTMELTDNVNELSLQVKDKLHATDTLFQAAREAGATIQETVHAAKEAADTLSNAVREEVQAPKKPWMAWIKIGLQVVSALRRSVRDEVRPLASEPGSRA
ncbi:DUF948 domain-containing protein [Cohnella zeiphila]|uniref:DUF948 domain-containing protein n=1 Tax=Cohnella zeiphila TaxID=2761120 RepID=A0A7X0VVZ9_9BACL|nr:DUF948 domain-containing protein [Cohnella zeiphila]MBB6731980.1 DUF948 domain-containing protein [Cohnella zeiphila]